MMTTRLLATLATTVGAGAVMLASATPASAHAIVELNGVPAYAGQTSVLTLEVQHGCLQNEAGLQKTAAYFSKDYAKVVPQRVPGWASSVTRSRAHLKIVWKLTGPVPAFNTPVFFPMKVTWPRAAGVYGLPVRQWCQGATNAWDEPDGPATATKPSPPLYPLPQIQVLDGSQGRG